MTSFINNGGSLWRKWDLHVHTPESLLNNQFGNWEMYLVALENLKDIAVLGITDYYSIEGYKKILKEKELGKLQNIDCILPNIEMRLKYETNGKTPDLHIIFSDEISVEDIERKFLNELEIEMYGESYRCNKEDLIKLGKKTNNKLEDDNSALREGYNQFKVDIVNINKILEKNNSIFKDKYLLIVPNSSEDGASIFNKNNSWTSHRVNLYKSVHAIFSGNSKDRTFFLGEGSDSANDIIEKYGSLKPCLHGSDAHTVEKIGNPDLDRHTWIKANTNFKGLLQVIHEPKDRVIIQKEKPEDKASYNIIKSIEFKDEEKHFQSEKLYLNPNLNVIIGGKSSGKSALLYKIAKTLSTKEVNKVQQEGYWKNPYSETFIEKSEFIVTLENGKVIKLSDCEDRRVQYIPQMYINILSEHPKNSVLQKKIKDILIDNKLLEISTQEKEIAKIQTEINGVIDNILTLRIEKEELRRKISEYALREDIEEELRKTLLIKEELLKNKGMTQNELKKYRLLNEQEELTKDKIQEVLNKIKVCSKSNTELNSISSEFINKIEALYTNHTEIDVLFSSYISNVEIAQNEIIGNLLKLEIEFEKEKEELNSKLEEIKKELLPYNQRLELQTDLDKLQVKIDGYQEHLKIISELRGIKDAKQKEIDKAEIYIKELLQRKYLKYQKIKEEVENINISEQLVVTVSINFKESEFEGKYLNNFIRKGKINNILDNKNKIIIDDQDRLVFNWDTYVEDIMHLFKTSSDKKTSELKLKKSITKEKMISSLMTEEYIQLVYDLKKGDDSLYSMSPGNRGLVLLELFLNLSDDKYPILIDQPEDNLDNRTISRELVNIIKEHKRQRQIIIVTHNANLAVLTDAENIIVANQDSSLQYNNESRFEYLTGALECSFIQDGGKLKHQGIREHTSEILEGGREAFELREKRYGFN